MQGDVLLFDEIIANLDGKRIHIHLQFVIVDDFVVEKRIEATPILKIAIHFADLRNEGFFHEGAENSN